MKSIVALYKLFLSAVVFLCISAVISTSAKAYPAWYNSSWQYAQEIVIDHTKVGASLVNFPFYISLNTLPAEFWSNVKSDGSDIVITNASGTKLDRELVSFSSTLHTGELWARVPSVSNTTDTKVYLYYGNPSASETSSTGVWDSNFKGVWHFEDNAKSDTFTDTFNSTNWTNDSHFNVNAATDKLLVSAGTDVVNAGIRTKYTFPGDFDVQIDFDSYSGANLTSLRLSAYKYVNSAVDTNNGFFVYRENGTINRFVTASKIAGTATEAGVLNSGAVSGKVRLVRVGTTLTGYYWNVNQWTSLGTYTHSNYNGSMVIKLEFVKGTTATSLPSCNFDNYIVNYGDMVADATSNINYMINNHATSGVGKIGLALSTLSNDASYLRMINADSFGTQLYNSTLTFWGKTNETGMKALLKQLNLSTGMVYGVEINRRIVASSQCSLETAVGSTLFYIRDNGGLVLARYITTNIYDNQFHMITWRVINATTNQMEIYIDGVLQTSYGETECSQSPNSFVSFQYNLLAGATNNRGVVSASTNASFDEFRFSSVTRSAGWISTDFNNQSSPSTFYSMGDDLQKPYVIDPPTESLNIFIDGTGEEWDQSLVTSGASGEVLAGVYDSNNTRRVAVVPLNIEEDLNWDTVTAGSSGSIAFFHVPGGVAELPGYNSALGGGFTLYIPKGNGNKIFICPGASSIIEVNTSCSGGYYVDPAAANVSVATEDSITYWKVSGLTGTGGMSLIEGLSDELTRLQVSTASDHNITFGTTLGLTASGQTFTLEFDKTAKLFNLSSLVITDIKLMDLDSVERTLASSANVNTWGVNINSVDDVITFTTPTSGTGYFPLASQIVVKIGTNAGGTHQITNPSISGAYSLLITLNNAGPGEGEQGEVTIPIVDSDQVNISGFVNTFINFDIDTAVEDTDCSYEVCLTHGGVGAISAINYTVDLGELNSTWVNKSNDVAVMHSDGNTGIINSIWFDLTTNAYNGAIVYVKSANAGLQGPATNIIPGVVDTNDIQANGGSYGFQLTQAGTGTGTILRNSNCDTVAEFCGPTLTNKEVFTTSNQPLDDGRIRLDIAAAAAYINNPGTYTDTLTFVAVPTY